MSVSKALATPVATAESVRRTVALLRRRGYALSPKRLGEVCLGGPISEGEVRWAVAASSDLALVEGLVVHRDEISRAGSIRSRADSHAAAAGLYKAIALTFVRTLVAMAPFIRSVAIAGSLASGGFRASDDVDLNLIVDDGYRHVAYVAVNFLGLIHALRYRAKPVDELTRRPLAPRLMTANLILEGSQCFPLERQDEDMAFELLMSQPVFGVEAMHELISANPSLLDHFPQLGDMSAAQAMFSAGRRAPKALYPRRLDGPARAVGEAAWRYMQWTRRKHPDALARVAFVRATMRPYTLFDQ